MIWQITQKEYKQIKKARKNRPDVPTGFLIWQAPNGLFYKNEQSGMAGAKEMTEWNRKIANDIDSQISLI